MSWAIAEVHGRRVLDSLSERDNKQAGIRKCQTQTGKGTATRPEEKRKEEGRAKV